MDEMVILTAFLGRETDRKEIFRIVLINHKLQL